MSDDTLMQIRKAFQEECTADEVARKVGCDVTLVKRWMETAAAMGELMLVPNGEKEKRWTLNGKGRARL